MTFAVRALHNGNEKVGALPRQEGKEAPIWAVSSTYLRPYVWRIAGGLSLKFTGTIMDLLLPWALAHIVDVVIPRKDMGQVLLWGLFMLLFSGAGLVTSVLANRSASRVARDATRRIRHDLFARIAHLSSAQVDRFTIPSLISRMTSDTYNIRTKSSA